MRWPDPADQQCPNMDMHDKSFGEMTLVGQKGSWLGIEGVPTNVYHARWTCRKCNGAGVNQYAFPAGRPS